MSNDTKNKLSERLDSLEARLLSMREGPDKALAKLKGQTNPEAVREQLVILLKAERYEEALHLVRSLPMNSRWADKAIAVCILADNDNFARELFDFVSASEDDVAIVRSRLHYADALLSRFGKTYISSSPVISSIGLPSDTDLENALALLRPLIEGAIKAQSVLTAFSSVALEISVNANVLLRNIPEARSLGSLWIKKTPIPLECSRFIFGRVLPATIEIAERYRNEHALSLRAQLIGSIIQGVILKEAETAYGELLKIKDLPKTFQEKENYCEGLFQLSLTLPLERVKEVEALCILFLGREARFSNIVTTEVLLRDGKASEAFSVLKTVEDNSDYRSLQMFARYFIAAKEMEKAREFFERAAEITQNSDLLADAARWSYSAGDTDRALLMLERAILLSPSNEVALANAIVLSEKYEDYGRAIHHLKALVQLQPDNLGHKFNLAQALALAGSFEESLTLYEKLTADADCAAEALVGHVHVLTILGRTSEAFKLLLSCKVRFWNEPHYVASLLQTSTMLGKTAERDEALKQLIELKRSGADEGILQPFNFEQFKAHSQSMREVADELMTKLRLGQVPWLLVDDFLGRPSLEGWRRRTQGLRWTADEPKLQAMTSVYATNSFNPMNVDDQKVLDSIPQPIRNSEVVVDLSALITLQQLNLLQRLPDFFKGIFVPTNYVPSLVRDISKCAQGDGAAHESFLAIKRAIDVHQLKIQPQRTLSFKLPEASAVEVLSVLHQVGQIADGDYRMAAEFSEEDENVSKQLPTKLFAGQNILLPLGELLELHRRGHLETALAQFDCEVSRLDHEQISATLRASEDRQKAISSTHTLIEFLRSSYVQSEAVTSSTKSTTEANEQDIDVPVAIQGLLLAKQKSLPLLADDRVCHVMVFNENAWEGKFPFSSDKFIVSLMEEGLISLEEACAHFLNLITWRYRFLVLPPKVLKCALDKYKSHPPGQSLKQIASYSHSCTRDQGLFTGLEATDPPSSIGVRFYQAWIRNIAEFLASVWLDPNYSGEEATRVTSWCVEHLVPCQPVNLAEVAVRMATFMPKTLLFHFLLAMVASDDEARQREAMSSLSVALRLSRETYNRLTMDAIDVF